MTLRNISLVQVPEGDQVSWEYEDLAGRFIHTFSAGTPAQEIGRHIIEIYSEYKPREDARIAQIRLLA